MTIRLKPLEAIQNALLSHDRGAIRAAFLEAYRQYVGESLPLYKMEDIEREEERIFAQSIRPDWEHWLKVDYVSLMQAAFLMLDIEPVPCLENESRIKKQFDMLSSWYKEGDFDKRKMVLLKDIVNKAAGKGLKVPNELLALANSTDDVTLDMSYFSKRLLALIDATKRFWGNANRNEEDTYPKNSDVEDYLRSRINVEDFVKSGARIIRPAWGRKVGRPKKTDSK
jgi:hypothetical protein